MKSWIVWLASALAVAIPASAQPCPCDCDYDQRVAINELTMSVGISLEREDSGRCLQADGDGDGDVAINELIAGVDSALRGCPHRDDESGELAAARARWQSLGLTHYEYRYQVGCFCPPPHDVRIEVLDGEIVAYRDAAGAIIHPEYTDHLHQVEEVFDIIANAIPIAEQLDVAFSAETGLPDNFYVDYQRLLADDELSLRLGELRDLSQATCSSSADCDPFDGACIEPGGFVGCGVCFDAQSDCDGDSDCSAAIDICAPIGLDPRSCACDPAVKVCQPGCLGDEACPVGTHCDTDHRCAADRCGDETACPAGFDCLLPPDSRTGACNRRSCTNDADCGTAFCVNGSCHLAPGRCEIIPP